MSHDRGHANLIKNRKNRKQVSKHVHQGSANEQMCQVYNSILLM